MGDGFINKWLMKTEVNNVDKGNIGNIGNIYNRTSVKSKSNLIAKTVWTHVGKFV